MVIDVLGLSGRRILQALIAGQTVPQALAALADRRIHATSAQLEAALRGRVTDHHRFMLKLHLDQIDAQDAAIVRIDKEVDGNVEPFRVAFEMLNGIPGVSSSSCIQFQEFSAARQPLCCPTGDLYAAALRESNSSNPPEAYRQSQPAQIERLYGPIDGIRVPLKLCSPKQISVPRLWVCRSQGAHRDCSQRTRLPPKPP